MYSTNQQFTYQRGLSLHQSVLSMYSVFEYEANEQTFYSCIKAKRRLHYQTWCVGFGCLSFLGSDRDRKTVRHIFTTAGKACRDRRSA